MANPFNRYLVGSSVTVTGTFTNHETGAPVNPSDARVDVVGPNGKSNTYVWDGGSGTVTQVGVGIFKYVIDTTALVGRWQYRWWSPAGTSVQTAGSSEFIVTPFPSATP